MSAATSRRIDPSAKLPESAPTTLFPLPEEREVTTWSSVSISLDRIIEDTHNPRRDMGDHDGSFAALVQSIKERGMLLPPLVRPVSGGADCQYHIIAGHRRIAAARALGWEDVRCTPMEDCEGKPGDYNDTERLIDTLVENTQRKDLNCIEVAEAIVRLEKLGRTQREIGRWVGRGQSWVSKCARLVTLPGGALTLLREGGLTQSHGEELLPLLGECFLPGDIDRLAHQASEQGLSVAGLRNVVRDKIERTRPVQATLDDYATSNTLGAGTEEDEFDARITRALAATKGLDKDPKPATKDTNNLTRKDSDKQFAEAMAPDPDVIPLSERPSGEKPKGTFFFLPSDVAELLFELSSWHRQEHGDLITADEKLADIVRSFHQAKLEMRIEAEAAKAALAATLPVFDEPVSQGAEPLPEPVVVTGDVFPVFEVPVSQEAEPLPPVIYLEAGEANCIYWEFARGYSGINGSQAKAIWIWVDASGTQRGFVTPLGSMNRTDTTSAYFLMLEVIPSEEFGQEPVRLWNADDYHALIGNKNPAPESLRGIAVQKGARYYVLTGKTVEVEFNFNGGKPTASAKTQEIEEPAADPKPRKIVDERTVSMLLEDTAFLAAMWRTLANHGHEKKLLAFNLPTTRGTVRRFSEMLSEAMGEASYWSSPGEGWVSGQVKGGKYPTVMMTFCAEGRADELAFSNVQLLPLAEKAIAWRHAQIEAAKTNGAPTPTPTDLYDAPQGIAEGVDKFAEALV